MENTIAAAAHDNSDLTWLDNLVILMLTHWRESILLLIVIMGPLCCIAAFATWQLSQGIEQEQKRTQRKQRQAAANAPSAPASSGRSGRKAR